MPYHYQGLLSTTPSNHSSPSSYAVSDSGDDRSYATSAIRTEPSNHRFSPYSPPSIQVTAPSFYSPSNGYSSGYALPHRRPYQDSRRKSYGASSRSTSSSLSPSPALSSPTRPRMPSIVKSESYFATGTDSSYYPHAPSQLAQVATASPSTPTLAPMISFPSLSLPLHPALAMFQRVPQLQRQVARLSQRTVERLIQPYRNESESERPFGILPQEVLDRVLQHVDYWTLLHAREVSRTCRRVINPQLADREDKIRLVRDMENRPRNCKTHSGGTGKAASCKGIPYKIGCYFCFTVKDSSLFETPGSQKLYAVVWIDNATKKARYEGLADSDKRIPKPDDKDFKGGIKTISGSQPSSTAETMGYGGGYGSPGQELAQSQVCHYPVTQPSQQSLYSPHNGSHQPQPYHNPRLQPHQQQQEHAVLISLRRYCMECGIQNNFYGPRSVIKSWIHERRLWVCNCAKLPPIERIHEQAREDFCSRCNVRASYR
ncbi:hypothetical protein MCOR25_004016 [Pyricularia grisea]|uniref:F-box domain-containing protein n=1 Tax=Pyricularia grisea TaxID=148305 RepID=A0A6P8AVE7_PYRGI|nr:uncharacterized protein PgNI_08642 [Pyricularia grisea]KAI6371080.1 hypothetical protein MCOR25_004016 [Pyricularia grisea]TLD06170.1 hypothetical protein PgNI_08642 [Pyricularia grisea]